jgi:His-Xaa-Ser system protein HxsD
MDTSAITVDTAEGAVRLEVDLDVHGRDAVLGAAYVFIDRCYVWIDKAADGNLVVQLKARGDDDTPLEGLAGEFGNELLAQSTRAAVYERNGDLIQAIVNRALVGAGAGGGAPAPLDLSELESLELEDEPFDDPLGIAMSWEEKYGKKTPDDSTEGS